MDWEPEPTAPGVKVTWHVAAAELLADRLQAPEGGVKLPVPLAVMVAVPVGSMAPVEEVSVTMTVQVVTLPTTTDEGEQLTIVEVA
jgi:hypothetical protein